MTSPKQNHSPLPWGKHESYIVLPTRGIGEPIARVVGKTEWGPACYEANQDFILRAVNSHYKLVEALKKLLSRYAAIQNCTSCITWNPETAGEIIEAYKAIALAEGETPQDAKK